MKKLVYIFFILLFISCKSVIVKNDVSEESEIINDVLVRFMSEYYEINILSKPYNEPVLIFKNGGFNDENNKLYRNKFYFKTDTTQNCNKRIIKDSKVFKGKISFIKNRDDIPKLGYDDEEKSKKYKLISNVMFTEDNTCAIVTIESFSNSKFVQYYEGYIYIYKKQGEKWVYSHRVLTAIS